MAKKENDPLWREFEKLAARIETTLSPIGAEVRTPDKVRDSITDEMREVDASIRYVVDEKEVLITLECRRRNQKQDVTWIEQLITKRRDIKADATIAITMKGVSKSAKIKAQKDNISIKTLEEITEEETKSWLNLKFADIKEQVYQLVDMALGLDDLEENEEILYDPRILELCGNDKRLYPIFEHNLRGDIFNYKEPLRLAKQNGFDLYEGCQEGQKKVQKLNYQNFDKNIVVRTNKGKRHVKNIYLAFEVSINKSQIPFGYLFRYGVDDKNIEGVEFDLSSAIQGRTLTLQKDKDTGKFGMHLIQKKQ